LTWSIFNKTLKDGSFAILRITLYLCVVTYQGKVMLCKGIVTLYTGVVPFCYGVLTLC